MRYSSTRGQVKNLMFEDAVMMGLADDGGLLVPNELPFVESKLEKWRLLSFTELSLEIMLLFTIASKKFHFSKCSSGRLGWLNTQANEREYGCCFSSDCINSSKLFLSP